MESASKKKNIPRGINKMSNKFCDLSALCYLSVLPVKGNPPNPLAVSLIKI